VKSISGQWQNYGDGVAFADPGEGAEDDDTSGFIGGDREADFTDKVMDMSDGLAFLNMITEGKSGFKTPVHGRGVADLHMTGSGAGVFEDLLYPVRGEAAVYHAQIGHDIEDTGKVGVDTLEGTGRGAKVFGVDGRNPCIAGDGEGTTVKIGRGPPDDGQVEGPGHSPLLFQHDGIGNKVVSGEGKDGQFGPARVQIDVVVRGADQLREFRGNLLRRGAVASARTGAGEIEAVPGGAAMAT